MAAKEHGNSVKDSVINIKNYIIALPKKRKIFWGTFIALILVAAVALTVALNHKKTDFRVLYSGLETGEAASVYSRLQEMGAQPQMDGDGNILVRAELYDKSLLQLASEGLPKSGLAYDVFDSHSGLTTTEAQMDQYKLYQLQDRLQDTLKKIEGVSGAAVTITPARESDYIWQQAAEDTKASASVLLTLQSGVELSPAQVQTVKNLVAASIYKLDASAVEVADAGTLQELSGTDETQSGYSAGKNLELEQMVQQHIEDNIVRLLTPMYGKDGVVAVAKITLDFDAMMTEKYDMSGVPDKNGNPTTKGYVTHSSQAGAVNGEVSLSKGIAGEENNTDIPGYVYTEPGTDGGATRFSRDVTIDYNYIKTQIEKGNAVISRATIAVMVDDPAMGSVRRQELIDNISKGADIPPELISVGSFRNAVEANQAAAPEQGENAGWSIAQVPWWVWAIVGGVLLLVILLVAVLLIVRRKRRRQEEEMLEAELEYARQQAAEEASRRPPIAEPVSEDSGSEIINEVRNFAKTNPEITAELLRTWLKEADES